MAQAATNLEPVLEDVLRAEHERDDVVDEEEVKGGDDIPETEVCGSLDDFSSEQLVPELEEDPAAAGGLVTVSKLDGVPLFFARGVTPRPQSFPIEPGFRDMLVATVKSVRHRAPRSFGDLKRITSAGAFVQKPGRHGEGRAFDHDAWTFEHVDIRPLRKDHASDSLAQRQRYWALAAIMRSQGAFVLHGFFDAAHRDHIHQDNSKSVHFEASSEATVKLAQAVCNDIFRQSPRLDVDGAFGPKTKAAVRDAMNRVDLPGDVNDRAQWKRFLLRSGRLGFELSMK